MHPLLAIALLVAGIGLLVYGSDMLVNGAARLARLLGMSPFAIGVTVVAFGTSTPELFASGGAALRGAPGMAVGNVIGSNIANIAMILGLTALVRPIPVPRRVRTLESPVMAVISVLAVLTLLGGGVGRLEGGLLTAGLIAYLIWTYFAGRRDVEFSERELELGHELGLELERPEPRSHVARMLLLIVLGLVGLGVGAELAVRGASRIASALGVSDAVIGLTIVAFGTSLPELATSARAAQKGESDIAVGNVIGSNVFNLLGVLGITALLSPLPTPAGVWNAVWVMLVVSAVVLPVLGSGGRIGRLSGLGLTLTYFGYSGAVYWLSR